MNNNDDIGIKCHQMYLESLLNMQQDSFDLYDECMVAMWNTVEALNQKFKALQIVAQDQAKTIAQYYSEHDVLHSRIAQLSGEKSLNEYDFKGGMQ